ncbi:MAG: diguanylate cyclase [Geminicoccaceae bacterium]
MRDAEERQATSRFAEQALATMRSYAIPPTPENFAVWYLHHAGRLPGLSRAIERLEERRTGVTADETAALHRSFCAAADHAGEVQAAGERVGELVDEVSRRLGVASSQTRDYSERLSTLGNGLSGTIDQEELFAMVRELEQQTELMSERVSSLQNELSQSSREIENLKGDLANARRAASTDPLTGIGNRKLFDEVFAREAREATMTGEPLALLVADIDHFKAFNDTHGHQIGDVVLKLVADRLKRSVKGRDTVVRYGGEEFAVLLPRTTLRDAEEVADHLRSEIAKSRLVMRNRGQELGKVTLSIGVGLYRPGEPTDVCFDRADQALYAAKHAGRNRVKVEEMLAHVAA